MCCNDAESVGFGGSHSHNECYKGSVVLRYEVSSFFLYFPFLGEAEFFETFAQKRRLDVACGVECAGTVRYEVYQVGGKFLLFVQMLFHRF